MNGCTGTSGAIMHAAKPGEAGADDEGAGREPRAPEMPCACASSGLLTMARMRVPVRLRPYQTTSAAEDGDARSAISSSR